MYTRDVVWSMVTTCGGARLVGISISSDCCDQDILCRVAAEWPMRESSPGESCHGELRQTEVGRRRAARPAAGHSQLRDPLPSSSSRRSRPRSCRGITPWTPSSWPSAGPGKILTRFQAKRFLSNRPHGLIVGRYIILDRIGSGSMGRVYKAHHVDDGPGRRAQDHRAGDRRRTSGWWPGFSAR